MFIHVDMHKLLFIYANKLLLNIFSKPEETILLENLIYKVLAIFQIILNIFMLVHLINDQSSMRNIWKRKGIFKVILSDIYWKASAAGIIPLWRVQNRKLHTAYMGGVSAGSDISGQNSSARRFMLYQDHTPRTPIIKHHIH